MSTSTPRISYHLTITHDRTVAEGQAASVAEEAVVLDAADVIAWVRGYAAAIGRTAALDVVDATAAEDTRRVQMLQIGDQQGWFNFMYQSRTGDDR
jgi:hypothetical protein